MLLVTYVTASRVSTTCYRRHISPYHVLSTCAISDKCCHSFINLNFVGLLRRVAEISTQFSMMPHSESEAMNASTFNMMTGHFVEFERRFCSKPVHFTANLGAITTKNVSEMGLYIIVSTLDKFERWNPTVLITKYKMHFYFILILTSNYVQI